MTHETTGCQCSQCRHYREHGLHIDLAFATAIDDFDAHVRRLAANMPAPKPKVVSVGELCGAVHVAQSFYAIVNALRRIVISSNN